MTDGAADGVFTQVESSIDSNSVISQSLLPHAVINVNNKSIPSIVITNEKKKAAYPCFLLARDKRTYIGECITKMILKDVKVKGGYSECLAHGKN